MELLLLSVTGFTIGLSGAMIPGPLFLFTVTEALRKDAKVGLKIISGHILFEALVMVLILIGFRGLLGSKALVTAISLIGGIALIVMGLIIIGKANRMSLSKSDGINFPHGAIIGGAFFSIISPGFLVWWATIGASLLLRAFLFGLIGVILLTLGHWAADVGWYWFVAISCNKGKSYLSDQAFRNIMRALALVLIILGIYFPVSTMM